MTQAEVQQAIRARTVVCTDDGRAVILAGPGRGGINCRVRMLDAIQPPEGIRASGSPAAASNGSPALSCGCHPTDRTHHHQEARHDTHDLPRPRRRFAARD